jgi:DNA-binding transcriptional LysR family regulator
MPVLKAFLDRNPGIDFEILLSQSLTNLTRNEADVVLRATNRPPETYIGQAIATHHFAVFGSRKSYANDDLRKPLNEYPWVLWTDRFTDDWMLEHVPNAHCVCRVNTALGMVEAIRSGMGVGHIACLAGDADAEFRRITAPHAELNLRLWLLFHEDLKRSTRIRVFCDYLAGELRGRRDLIEGRQAWISK